MRTSGSQSYAEPPPAPTKKGGRGERRERGRKGGKREGGRKWGGEERGRRGGEREEGRRRRDGGKKGEAF